MEKIKKRLKKWWPLGMPCIFLVLSVLFFFTTKNQLQYGAEQLERSINETSNNIGEIKSTDIIEQNFMPNVDVLTRISILFATYSRINDDTLHVSVLRQDDRAMLFECSISTDGIKDNTFLTLPLTKPLTDVFGEELVLRIESQQGDYGNAVTIYCGDTPALDNQIFYINGEPFQGSLSFELAGKNLIPFAASYWSIISIIFLICLSYSIHVYRAEKNGKGTLEGNAVRGLIKYWFLLRQLVARDFKTKYKRSVLGVLWSLLNPLLTMTVQYIVFSTLFRFEIPNYPVYLLSGIVFFNYMSDATSQSMMCIVQNASLINKVYVPKYIYPLSRVLSCGVNFVFSLVALYIMILFTGIHITSVHIFLLYGILCTFLFILGVSLLLSALMVFFRDIQFLYGVFLQMWIYLTPLFYPESILPGWVMRIVEFNPMYHFIRFIRIIILGGTLPEFKAWIFCAVFALVPLVIGCYVFRRVQKKFILYI